MRHRTGSWTSDDDDIEARPPGQFTDDHPQAALHPIPDDRATNLFPDGEADAADIGTRPPCHTMKQGMARTPSTSHHP
ncbi:MAG: hypothetical protein O2924_02485 [Chloroflexi bacterium]|nr:hypothetical protein [Chloroflexota bacterium]